MYIYIYIYTSLKYIFLFHIHREEVRQGGVVFDAGDKADKVFFIGQFVHILMCIYVYIYI
jgi:hypothetical protein